MGDDWRTRFEPKVRAFYFQSKHNLGYAPRFDQLADVESEERTVALEKAKQWHTDKIPVLKKAAYKWNFDDQADQYMHQDDCHNQ